jgi:hypothetical protein
MKLPGGETFWQILTLKKIILTAWCVLCLCLYGLSLKPQLIPKEFLNLILEFFTANYLE